MAKSHLVSICGFVFVTIVVGVLECESISVWDDITLSTREKHALDKFKMLMNNTVTHDFMRKDIYLIKWLRARDLNLEAAQQMLKQHLKWRRQFGMDSIVEEDWSKFEDQYRYTIDGVDLEGRPVLAVNVADWDIRRAILSGQKDALIRYSFGAYEKGAQMVREMQAEGQNVTQFVMVCNFDGFNLVQHACLQCVQVLVGFLSSYEDNFPGMADSIIGIKTPASFEILLQALKQVMSKETQDAVKIWGPNKQIWQTNILKQIPADQLEEEFGGTRFRYR